MVVTMLTGPARLVPLGDVVVEFRPGVPVEVSDSERARFAKDSGFRIQEVDPPPSEASTDKRGKVKRDG